MSILRKLKWLIQRRDKEAELREEIEFHLSEEAEDSGADAARRDLVITTNTPFSDWGNILFNTTIATAIAV